MRARWIIESKFDRPRLQTHQIERTRVVERLRAADCAVALVQAPAGFGKSTLLAQWAHDLVRSGVSVAWINLDEDDRQLEQFAAYVLSALRRCLGVDLSGDRSGSFHSGVSPKSELLAVLGEVNRRGRRVALVLDDYHRAETEEIDEIMRGFIERAAPAIRIAISSRFLPQLGLARLKAEGRAAIVTERELRFNAGETRLFFDSFLPSAGPEWDRFVERAEGWPVALQFARMWLSDGGDLAALGVASETTDLGAYLSEQVFSSLPAEARDFLLRTSPLEDISSDAAQAIGVDNADRLVCEIARLALPITMLSPEPTRFRCHHLLQDFLQSRAKSEGIDLSAIHRKAARWFAQRGVLASAVRHALAGADAEYAAALLDQAGGWRLIYGGQGQSRAILRSVHAASPPAAQLPRLALGAAILAAKSGDLATARMAFRDVVDGPAAAACADDVRVIDALIRLYCDEPIEERALEGLIELGARIPADDLIGTALTSNLIAFFMLQKGDFVRAKRFGGRATEQFRRAEAVFGETHLYAHVGAAELALGNRAAATEAYRTMRDLCRTALGPDSDLEAIAAVLEAETCYEADERLAARELLGPALSRIEQADGWFDVFAAGYVTAARLEHTDHGPAAAMAALDRGKATALGRDMRRLSRLLAEETIRAATLARDFDLALAECRRLDFPEVPTDEIPAPVSALRGDGVALLVARLRLALGDVDGAAGFLAGAEGQMQRQGAPLRRRITARMLGALIESERGSPERAAAAMMTAVRLAISDQFFRTLLDEGPAARDLIAQLGASAGLDAALLDRIARLLGKAAAPARPAGAAVLSARERQILGLLATGLTNKEIARSIALDPNTVKYHLKRLFTKLAVERRGRAVLRARQYGLIE